MLPFPLYLNEQSLSARNLHPSEKLASILIFINTLISAKKNRPDIELHNSQSLYECELGEGDFLCTILKGNNYIDHWRFIKTLAQKNPWAVSSLSVDIVLNGQRALGVALAIENRSATISIPFEPAWKNNVLNVNVGNAIESVPNLAKPEHVNFWGELFRDYGVDVSTSSIVFQADFVIRMYLNDHNPPHVHAEYSGHKATIDIRRLDILGGRLPTHISNDVITWVLQNQQALLENWERCRIAANPILIGN